MAKIAVCMMNVPEGVLKDISECMAKYIPGITDLEEIADTLCADEQLLTDYTNCNFEKFENKESKPEASSEEFKEQMTETKECFDRIYEEVKNAEETSESEETEESE